MGNTSYPDNVVQSFAKEAKHRGMDVFRVFDSLNYADNLLVGCDAVHEAGGVVQGEVCFTGNLSESSKYNLDYYLALAEVLVKQGHTHVLGVKDMAGLLTPSLATKLVSALKHEFPDTPLHVHTHDKCHGGSINLYQPIPPIKTIPKTPITHTTHNFQ